LVEAGLGDESANPFAKVYGGMILGNERFVRGILQRLKDREAEGEEISNRKDLRRGLEPQEVLTAVSSYFRVNPDDVLSNRRSIARRAFVYVLKRYGAIGNREICKMVGCTSISAATKICHAFERELNEDAALLAGFTALVEQFSTFKGRPL
jgi:chromosomal replication initiation ATPase DnaA